MRMNRRIVLPLAGSAFGSGDGEPSAASRFNSHSPQMHRLRNRDNRQSSDRDVERISIRCL
jgi:hypothetical protein